MKNKIFFMVIMFFYCGNAWALPQDWPCKIFELQKQKENANSDDDYIYRGQDGNYKLSINVFWRSDMRADDCGTAGCAGTIENIKTGDKENLRFFCEAEDNSNIAKCYVRKGEEYILSKVSEGYYQVNLCQNTSYKYIHIDECFGCTCILHDSNKQNGDSDLYMACKRNGHNLHCMTGNIYEEKYNPADGVDDFKNCVGLTSF